MNIRRVGLLVIATMALLGCQSGTEGPAPDARAENRSSTLAPPQGQEFHPYPEPEEFRTRWNQALHIGVDDSAAMTIPKWQQCPMGEARCYWAPICNGHGEVRAQAQPNEVFVYTVNLNAANALLPSSSPSCPSVLRRVFNTLYASPREAQSALTNFLSLNGTKGPTPRRVIVDRQLYDVIEGPVRAGVVTWANPTLSGDSDVDEFVSFAYAHTEVVTLRINPQPNLSYANDPPKTSTSGASKIGGADAKNAVIEKIFREKSISPSSVSDMEASVEQVSDIEQKFHVAGHFSTESDRPDNFYDALSLELSGSQCALDPNAVCGRPMVKHIIYFDAIARVAKGPDGTSAFIIDERLSRDKPIAEPPANLLQCDGRTGEVVFSMSPGGYKNCRLIGNTTDATMVVRKPESPPSSTDANRRLKDSSTDETQGSGCPPESMRLVKQDPVYPVQAIRQGHEGKVFLSLTFDRSGAPVDIQIDQSSGFRELDKAAQDSARTWRVTSAGCSPEATAQMRVPVTFALNRH